MTDKIDFQSRRQDKGELYKQVVAAGGRPHRNNTFQCPFHDDRKPSAGIKKGSRGYFFHCFVCGITKDVWDIESELKGVTLAELVKERTGSSKTTGDWKYTFKSIEEMIASLDAIDVHEINKYTNPETENIDLITIRYIPRGDHTKKFLQAHQTEKGFIPKRPAGLLPIFNRFRVKESDIILYCYSDDTEILTHSGWKLFKDVTIDEEVAQYNKDNEEISFVTPLERQMFNYNGDMVAFDGKLNNILVTPDHRMLVRNETKDKIYPSKVITAHEVSTHHRIPFAGFKYEYKIEMSIAKARLIAAYIADGIKPKTSKTIVKWNLKKSRKKDRIRKLLADVKIPILRELSYPSCPEWTDIAIEQNYIKDIIDAFPNKVLNLSILDWPLEARESFIEELGFWDGDFSGSRGIRFFTGKKEEAEIVSCISVTCGYACIIRQDDHKSTGPTWVVNLNRRNWRDIMSKPNKANKSYVPYNGKVYCCTVPTGFLVVRRKGKPFISGNCEGEKCVRKLTELGFTATTASGGSKNPPSANDYSPLSGKKVILWADNDNPGREYMAQVRDKLLELDPPPTVFEIPVDALELPETGDVVDLCEKVKSEGGIDTDCVDYIQSLVDDASEVNRLQCLEDLLQDMRDSKYINLPIKDFPIITNEAKMLLNKRIGIVYGLAGIGKSLFIGKLCDDLLAEGRKVVRLQLEDEMEQHLLRSLAQVSLRGELANDDYHRENPLESKVLYEQFKPILDTIATSIVAGENEVWNDKKILGWIESKLEAGYELIVIDPISVILEKDIWIVSHRLMWATKALLSKYPNSRVIFVSHPNAELEVAGGQAFKRFSHSMLMINRFKAPKQVELIDCRGEIRQEMVDTSILIAKSRYGRGGGLEIAVRIDGSSLSLKELGIITREIKEKKPVGRNFDGTDDDITL